jgi:hypothetical protein
VYAFQGDARRAVAVLEEHFDEINKPYNQLGYRSAFEFLPTDTSFDPIRTHPSIIEFLDRHAGDLPMSERK